ncbi:MAG: formylglycine-generating enzyme family protein [Treponemataceae bacterium]
MKKRIYGIVVFLTAISLFFGSCKQPSAKAQTDKPAETSVGANEKQETFQITVKAESSLEGCYEVVYKAGDNEKAVKKGNVVKVNALVSNLKVNSTPLEKGKSTEIPIEADTVIEIIYESNATNETEKLAFDKELVEASHYTVLYSATPQERRDTLKNAIAPRLRHNSTLSVEVNSGAYIATLENGSQKENVELVVAEENDYCRMIVIPASGDITLGGGVWETENPEHKTNVKAFKMSESLVTQGLFKEIMGFNPSYFNAESTPPGENQDLRPVDSVSWFTAAEFCNRLTEKIMGKEHCVYTITDAKWRDPKDVIPKIKAEGIYSASVKIDKSKKGFRIPDADEWEWAAGCGDEFKYAGSDTLNEVAWNLSNSGGVTHQVKKLKPNKFNLYDMSGNLWEWCGNLEDGSNTATSSSQTVQKGACALCPHDPFKDIYFVQSVQNKFFLDVTREKSGFRIACNAE